MSERISKATITDAAGVEHDVTDALRALLRQVESHHESLALSIEDEGSFDDGLMSWEQSYRRAEGEESIANVAIDLAAQFGIIGPSEADFSDG